MLRQCSNGTGLVGASDKRANNMQNIEEAIVPFYNDFSLCDEHPEQRKLTYTL